MKIGVKGFGKLTTLWAWAPTFWLNEILEFSKLPAQNTKKKEKIGNKLAKLETNTEYIKNLEYMNCWNKLHKIYKQKINGIRIQSKCDW